MLPDLGDAPKHFLHPCTIFVHREEHWVSTILGSCVAVCLWDPEQQVGGMNHFMLPLWNGEGLPTPRYGNIAIEKLIEKMQALRCPKERLVAKAFGGARVIKSEIGITSIGDRNIDLAREILAEQGIPLVASQLGGLQGLKILFNTRTGHVLVARMPGEDGLAVQGGVRKGLS